MRWLTILPLVLVSAWGSALAGPPKPGQPPVIPPPVVPPVVQPTVPPKAEFSPEAVDAAIEKGVKYLISAQKPDGSWSEYPGYPGGSNAAATYALLESGLDPQSAKMRMALDWLATHPSAQTYVLGLRCNVWFLADRKLGGRCRSKLKGDVEALIEMCNDGAYSYGVAKGRAARHVGHGDNSNAQYGVLGAWAAARDAKIEIGDGYWKMVLNHWLRAQGVDGGWSYGMDAKGRASGGSTGAMTCAGLASTLVCIDNLQLGDLRNNAAAGAMRAVEGGLAWLEKNFENTATAGISASWELYYYYGIERVGLASGMKYFGDKDWYKIVGTKILSRQAADGSWAFSGSGLFIPMPGQPQGNDHDRVVGTAYSLLFLIRGRAPLVFNKLQYACLDEQNKPALMDWNCRPRELAHLCAWWTDLYERTLNWQVINTKVPVSEWHDAPILYISGYRRPNFSAEEIAKLRQYVLQGGTIFSTTGYDAKLFRDGIRKVYSQVFPEYEMIELPADHELYTNSSLGKPLKGRPKFFMVTNGVRPLIIHVDEDIAKAWQGNQVSTRAEAFEAATHVFMYVTAQGRMHNRATHTWPEEFKFSAPGANPPGSRPAQPPVLGQPGVPGQPPVPGQPGVVSPPVYQPPLPPEAVGKVKIVRLEWAGNWNPEPLALERFSRLLAKQMHIQAEIATTPVANVGKSGATVAILSGQGKFQPKKEDLEALKAYVQAGGTLVVDAAGGDEVFAGDVSDMLRNLLPGTQLSQLAKTHPLYVGMGLSGGEIKSPNPEDKDAIRYRRKTAVRLGDDSKVLQLKGILLGRNLNDRIGVFYSREDLTCAGLVGYYSFSADGYDPGVGKDGSAYKVMRNIVLYAMGEKARGEAMKKLALQNAPPPPATQPVNPPIVRPPPTGPVIPPIVRPPATGPVNPPVVPPTTKPATPPTTGPHDPSEPLPV